MNTADAVAIALTHRKAGRGLIEAAEAALALMGSDEIHDAAQRWVIGQIIAGERSAVRTIEQTAGTPAPASPRTAPSEDLYLGKYRHGSSSKTRGAVPRGCSCPTCEEVRTLDAEHRTRFHRGMTALLDGYAAHLRMEWTTELLASSFALGDGTSTTWGAATIAQHEQRIGMLTDHAGATLETAARHRAAVEAIRTAGAERLDQVVAPCQPIAAL